MRTDEELMQEVVTGEFEAFEELVRRYQRMAVGLARNLLNDSDRAEEMAQEAFLKILRNADHYEPTATFKTYLTRVVTRLCYDRTEKNKPGSFDPQHSNEPNYSEQAPLDEILEAEKKQSIHEALDGLPPRQKIAIVLQHFEEFTYEEIAETMEITERSVEGLLARARENLRTTLLERIDADELFGNYPKE